MRMNINMNVEVKITTKRAVLRNGINWSARATAYLFDTEIVIAETSHRFETEEKAIEYMNGLMALLSE